MAKRPAQGRSCWRGRSKCERNAAFTPLGHRRHVSAAILKVSNDRRSGERGSAGLERRAPRHDENGGDAIEMLDCLRAKRHRQLRRLGNKRIGGEVDRGANRAVIVCLIAGLVVGKRGRSRRSGNRDNSGSARDAVEMDVSERHEQSAAPAPRAPANCRIGCCNGPNASGHSPPSATASVYDGSGLAQEPPSRTLVGFSD